jgi:hypothetical protein
VHSPIFLIRQSLAITQSSYLNVDNRATCDPPSLGGLSRWLISDEALSRPLAGVRVIRRVKGDNAVVGQIDDLGYLQSVQGYDSKLNALDNHTRVIVPAVDKQNAEKAAKDDKDLQIVAAAHWKNAARSARHANAKVVLRQGLAAGLAIALVVGLIAWLQHKRVVSETFAADSGTLAAQSQKTGDPSLARLEAVAAWNLDQTPEAGYSMLKAASLPPYAVLDDGGTTVGPSAFSGDNRLLAVGLRHNDIKIWEVATRQLTATLTGGISYDELTG